MYLFIEAWTPKPAWLALSREEREAYVSRLTGGMPELQAAGIEVVGWGFSDGDARGTQHVAFAVWRCPSRQAANQLRQAVERSRWYEYFEQLDLGGEVQSPEVVLEHHVDLGSS